MPLVKSPVVTPRKLAANRANSGKSTGPRTERGKQAVLLNRLRHSARSDGLFNTLSRASLRQQIEFARIYAALFYALCPTRDEICGMEFGVVHVWRMKHAMERVGRHPILASEVVAHGGSRFPPYRRRWQRPGFSVTVTVGLRNSRARKGQPARKIWWMARTPCTYRW